ncbi:hypothetical protein MIMGU_mgv1a025885mg, partial [Erythranthe guttata]
MEIGGNSNNHHKDTTRASASASENKYWSENVTKHSAGVLRRALPPAAKISHDVKEIIQECVSVFISFVTSEANENVHREYKKTIHPEDVITAMGSLGFDDYVDAHQPSTAPVAPPVPPPPPAPLVVMGDGPGGGDGEGSPSSGGFCFKLNTNRILLSSPNSAQVIPRSSMAKVR